MESVILVTPFDFELKLKQRLEKIGYMVSDVADGFALSDGSSRLYINQNISAQDEYNLERLETIKKLIPCPNFYTIDYSDISLCRKVLEIIADDPNLLVDNDHGLLLPGPEFVQIIRGQREWDWRKEAL